MKFLLVLFVLVGVAYAEVAKLIKCEEFSDDICEVTELRITPCKNSKNCKLKKKEMSSIDFDFIPKFAASEFTAALYWASPSGDIPFSDFNEADACPYTTCPLEEGKKQTLNFSLRLRQQLPSGKYLLKWKLWKTGDLTKTCCFKANVEIRR